ncbi:protoglobin domain-containing protein [Thalassobaculum fulvum]|nr:protoglobin domain-containing protein [Thalassobaculum fulvum]
MSPPPGVGNEKTYVELTALATEGIIKRIDRRLAFYQINDDARSMIVETGRIIDENMPQIIAAFYRHVGTFPEAARFLSSFDVAEIKLRQKEHWNRLMFSGFSEDYVHSAVRVGVAHYRINLPLYLYISGYNNFMGNVVDLIVNHYLGALVSAQHLRSMIKAISFDMDIAISVYTVADRLKLKPGGSHDGADGNLPWH